MHTNFPRLKAATGTVHDWSSDAGARNNAQTIGLGGSQVRRFRQTNSITPNAHFLCQFTSPNKYGFLWIPATPTSPGSATPYFNGVAGTTQTYVRFLKCNRCSKPGTGGRTTTVPNWGATSRATRITPRSRSWTASISARRSPRVFTSRSPSTKWTSGRSTRRRISTLARLGPPRCP